MFHPKPVQPFCVCNKQRQMENKLGMEQTILIQALNNSAVVDFATLRCHFGIDILFLDIIPVSRHLDIEMIDIFF